MTRPSKILTIGVPTYNRGFSLDRFIPYLLEDMGPLAAKVTVIISDNCSSDRTQAICEEHISTLGDLADIRYFRQSENVGVSRNIVSLFYACETPYFMFLGDDDRLNAAFFPQLMALLESKERPSAVIQAFYNGGLRYGKSGLVDFGKAVQLFAEYGCAFAGVIDAKAAVKAIEQRNLRAAIEATVWPQTVMAYLAMNDQQPRPIYLAPEEIGFQFTEKTLNLTNRNYWVRSTLDLAIAAVLVDKGIGGFRARSSYVRLFNVGFAHGIAAITVAAFTEKNGESSAKLRTLLREEYGWRGIPWRMHLFLTDYSVFYSEITIGTGLFFLRMLNRDFKITVKSLKEDRRKRLAELDSERDRVGDWF